MLSLYIPRRRVKQLAQAHIPRRAFAFLVSVRPNGSRPELEDGQSWDDRVNPETGELVLSAEEWFDLFI